MRTFLLFFFFFITFQLDLLAQETSEDIEHYEIAGAKLGRKIARQVVQGHYERTPTTNRLQTLTGWGFEGRRSGYHRPVSFVGAMDGAVMGSLAHKYKYQNYYHGPRQFNYRKKKEYSSNISTLEIANITYADENGDGTLSKDESAQIYFDLINTGNEPLFGITPILLANKTKHILISDPCIIDTLNAKSALRYVIEISGDGKRNPGNAYLLLRIKYGQQQYADIKEIVLGTRRRVNH